MPLIPNERFIYAEAGGGSSFAIRSDGVLKAWGQMGHGRLGVSQVGTANSTNDDPTGFSGRVLQQPKNVLYSVKTISVSALDHTVSTGMSGGPTLWGWGRNFAGQIGDGYLESRTVPQLISFGYQDSDGDGLPDWREAFLGTNPNLSDTNGDGLGDFESFSIGIDPLHTDTDGDGLNNATEVGMGTSPLRADTDGDGVDDSIDDFPLDPTRTSAPSPSPGDTTAPNLTITKPVGATLIDP